VSAAGLPAFFSDAVFQLAHDADPTRRAVFDLAAIAAGPARSFALPDVSTELAGLSGAQTFDGDKTFAGALAASGAVATIGTAPGTATYGLGAGPTAPGATTTVNLGTGGAAGSDTVVNLGSDTPGADGVTVVNTPTVTFANGVTVVGMPQANLTALLLGLGGAVADAWNRLSVNTPAVLLNNAGAGIEATVNKAAPGNDAAFAFKTGFSARALIGLLGSDDFSFKVSPDGSAYHEAILVDRNRRRWSRLAAEADLLRERLALRRVARRSHRVVPPEPPALAVFLRRHAVIGHQVALEHLQLLAVLEADDVVVGDRAADRHRRGELDQRRGLLGRQPAQRIEDRLDERPDLGAADGVVADMRRDDLGGEGEKLAAVDDNVFGHSRVLWAASSHRPVEAGRLAHKRHDLPATGRSEAPLEAPAPQVAAVGRRVAC
jgi:hypothetical protein